MSALALKIGLWLFVKSLESAAEEYLDDGDADRMRTRIIEYIQARQGASRTNGSARKVKSRVWRFMAIVFASNRLDDREQRAVETEKWTEQSENRAHS